MFVEKACKVFIGCAYVETAETEFCRMMFDGTWLLCWNRMSVLVDDIKKFDVDLGDDQCGTDGRCSTLLSWSDQDDKMMIRIDLN